MNFSYEELLEAQKKYGTSKEDIREIEDYDKLLENIVIAPCWKVDMFDKTKLQVTKINNKVYNLSNGEIDFSFIQVNQVGAPAIIEEVLTLGVSDCKNLIFLGSVGSLDENISIGDIVIPDLSICGDGASRYLNKDLSDDFGKKEEPNKQLLKLLSESSEKIIKDIDVSMYLVNNFSVDTVFGQFPHIDKIQNMGAKTIEMETYTLFKASRIVGINATALLCVSDNSIVNKSLFSGRTEEDNMKRKIVKTEIIPKIIIDTFTSLDNK